ncbi:phage minor capsid protein [uncultured Eubacterium sp.]|uniref:phage minor capsid protein n=1 Tax=uncultured Eubacterium sp. TaxID=165185 RepID=UPI0025F4F174|nr:phage minor capsid protein [uncultured Eubacterium sp.]
MEPYDIGAAFETIEDELIASMIRNMKRHRVEEVSQGIQWSQWQAEQLKALEKFKKQNQKLFSGKFKEINSMIEDAIKAARQQGNMDQEIAILEAIKGGFKGARKQSRGTYGEFFRLNDRKLNALIKATTNDFKNGETAMLRQANDQYRQIIYNAQVYANTGAGTYEKAVDMATKDFLSRGITCIEYANGARHAMKDYADMAIRTATKRAYLTGEGEKRQEWGIHTVILNKRGDNPCPKCLPFVGKVLIDDVWSGGSSKDGPYPLMSHAIARGLYHPRCKDSHTTYFPGLSTADDTWTQEELDNIEWESRQEAKQQYAKRQEEKYDRLAKYSLDQENQKQYTTKKEQWKIEAERKAGVKNIVKSMDSDIMVSGARITDPDSTTGEEFAKMYYEEIKKFSTDVQRIAINLGKDENDIGKIKAYLFEDKSLYDEDTGEYRRFAPDCAIAQSWQRLMIGKHIQPHDRTLIEHELYEMQLKEENPELEHWKAHEMACRKYDYQREAADYYGNIKKYNKNKN